MAASGSGDGEAAEQLEGAAGEGVLRARPDDTDRAGADGRTERSPRNVRLLRESFSLARRGRRGLPVPYAVLPFLVLWQHPAVAAWLDTLLTRRLRSVVGLELYGDVAALRAGL